MVVVKNMKVSHVFSCLQNKPKNVFENILETKKSFEDYKIEKFKKSKNWDFSKGLVHGFGQKVKMWPCFCFSQNKAKNVFDNILETKT